MKYLIKCWIVATILLTCTGTALACPWCRVDVTNAVYDQDFVMNLFMLMLPLVLLAGVGLGVYHGDKIRNRSDGGVN